MTDQWGLTEHGFLRPSYNDLLDAYEVRAKELFGAGTNLTVRSPMGIFIRIFAWFSGLAWQLAETVYNSGYIDTAAGVSLARLGAFIGIRRLAAQKATGSVTITGDPGARISAGMLFSSNSGARFVTIQTALIGADGTVITPVQAFDVGPAGNVDAGEIVHIVTPVATITGVTNADPTAGGRDRETDQQFRDRYLASVDKPGGSNTDAIRAELLTLPGVLSAQVWENETDEVDEDGLLPHSILAIVYGGHDDDIQRAIFRRKAGGIQTNGNVEGTVVDASGRTKTILFSRPAEVPIFVHIYDIVTDPTYGGPETIQAAVINYIGSADSDDDMPGLPIGESVYYNRLICPINAVVGLVDYGMEISVDGDNWYKDNVTIGPAQKVVTSLDKVVIIS